MKKDPYEEIVKSDFLAYNYHVHNENCTAGNERWKPGRFHKDLCKRVQEFVEAKTDKPYSVMLIMTPPQHGKSMSVTETLPSFYLGHNPEGKVIVGCYNADYSRKFGIANRNNVRNYGFLFNEKLSSESKSADEFMLDNKLGKCICRGLAGGITGNGANLIVIDDPIKNSADAMSKTYRDKIWDEYIMSVKTRTADDAKVIIIMTPWHEDDLAGRVQKAEKNLTILRYPCECEDEKEDLLHRKKGDSLCPEIGKDNHWLKQFKESFLTGDLAVEGNTGRKAWYSMFQTRPVSEAGNVIKREWWKYYDALPKMDKMIMSVDCAFKNNEKNDYVAIEVIGKKDGNFYLIEVINEHLDFPQTVSAILGVKSRYPQIREVLIEDKANGPAVMSVLQGKLTGVIPVTPNGGKESRVNSISYAIEAGNCYIGRSMKEFVEQCSSFPNAAHDDMVDAFTQGIARLLFFKSRIEKETIDHYKYITFKKKKKHGERGEKIIVI